VAVLLGEDHSWYPDEGVDQAPSGRAAAALARCRNFACPGGSCGPVRRLLLMSGPRDRPQWRRGGFGPGLLRNARLIGGAVPETRTTPSMLAASAPCATCSIGALTTQRPRTCLGTHTSAGLSVTTGAPTPLPRRSGRSRRPARRPLAQRPGAVAPASAPPSTYPLTVGVPVTAGTHEAIGERELSSPPEPSKVYTARSAERPST
jgi:hypothetical protein